MTETIKGSVVLITGATVRVAGRIAERNRHPHDDDADHPQEILDGFEAGEEESSRRRMARGVAQGIARDPNGTDLQLTSPG